MLTVLAGLAELERELIRARMVEGRARAKVEERKRGHTHKLTLHQQREDRERRDKGEGLSSIAQPRRLPRDDFAAPHVSREMVTALTDSYGAKRSPMR